MEKTMKEINEMRLAAEALAENLTGIQWNQLIFLLGRDDPLTPLGRKNIIKDLINILGCHEGVDDEENNIVSALSERMDCSEIDTRDLRAISNSIYRDLGELRISSSRIDKLERRIMKLEC